MDRPEMTPEDAEAHARWLERERKRQPHLGDKFQASADAIRWLLAEVRTLEDKIDDINSRGMDE